MGSFKHKMNNKKQKKKDNAAVNELIELKKKMKEQYKAGEYVEAMDTMAEIAQHKKMDPEIMYMGASCYFMTGDYERAVRWAGDTLTYDPQNIAARLLLARLCFVEDKPEDGFAILSFVVEKYAGGIRDEENKVLLEMLEYCSDNMAEMMSQYSPLIEYFHKYYIPVATPQLPQRENSSIQDMLEASLTSVEDNKNQNADIEPTDDGKSKAQAAVARLKALLNKSKGNKVEDETNSSQTPEAVQEPVQNADNNRQGDEASTEEAISQAMNSNSSFREKIQQLNNIAGKMYINDNHDEALTVLQKALEIDANDPFILKNIAYLYLAMGDTDKALDYAGRVPMMDFALIRAIKGHCHG